MTPGLLWVHAHVSFVLSNEGSLETLPKIFFGNHPDIDGDPANHESSTNDTRASMGT